ncbi:MAG: OsmC family protein [Pseudomonadota bacterium]
MDEFNITFPEKKRVDVRFKTFELKTDQSIENGGEESAPEPFELFLSSIGACAGIYAKSFCDFRKLSTSGMHLSLDVFFKDGQKLMETIKITLYVNQAFPEKYIRSIIKSMNGCAVKNQLHPDIKTETTVVYMEE